MAKLDVVLRDDDGNVISIQKMDVDIGGGSLDEIEGAVERAKRQLLPHLEKRLLEDAQERIRREKRGS